MPRTGEFAHFRQLLRDICVSHPGLPQIPHIVLGHPWWSNTIHILTGQTTTFWVEGLSASSTVFRTPCLLSILFCFPQKSLRISLAFPLSTWTTKWCLARPEPLLHHHTTPQRRGPSNSSLVRFPLGVACTPCPHLRPKP